MPIFQTSVLKKYLSQQDNSQVEKAYKDYSSYFLNPQIQENIRNSKEEQFQEGFLRELFVKILGYTLNPDPNFNLTTELKNEKGSKKTDGAILKDGKALGVVELKGTDTKDLDKVNEQAFSYKNNHTDCVYVITSNFEKLRFFIHNAVEHIEFNLFTLGLDEFKVLWLCLQVDNLLNGIPQKVKEESLLAEENITKQLYKDYSAFKTALWQNMVKNHPGDDALMLFKKTQKLLDRFLFIFFAEDSGLLPPNSIRKIIDKWKDDTDWGDDRKLYDIFKQYFGFINAGRPAKGDREAIFGYNGGLFMDDLILDKINIDDDVLLKYTEKLSAYDFQSEVDVNILGHIFENSLNEIENITAELEGKEIEKSKTKRKKDGVFYTPKYITKYIVDNTLGKLCEDKKAELHITDERFGKASKRSRKGIDDLQAYRDWLLDLKICDPACGSGAFLNQALEFLIDEHRYLDELTAQYHKSPLVLSDIETQILEQNIYGVDINEESVEIAKLSLWLRTAQKGRKLTSLNNNIKCGNSLIDDPEVAGDKAFNWQKEFPTVFEKGGFDVVIGNPPYVNLSEFPSEIHDYFKKEYSSIHTGYNDLMYYFLYIGVSMLNQKGSFGVITSNYFIGNDYAKGIRNYLAEHLVQIINFDNYHVFKDANVHTAIVLADKNTTKDFVLFDTYSCGDSVSEIVVVPPCYKRAILKRSDLLDTWLIAGKEKLSLLQKLSKGRSLLGEISEIAKGPESGKNEVFTINKSVVNKYKIEQEVLRKCIKNSDIDKYKIDFNNQYIIYADNDFSQDLYPNAYNYLEQHKEVLLNRRGPKTGEYEWWRLHRPSIKEIFDSVEKILVPYRAKNNRFGYDNKQFFNNGGDVRAILIVSPKYSTKFVVAVLNSALIDWFYGFIGKPKGNSREYFNKPLSLIPIPEAHVSIQESVSFLVDELSEKKGLYQELFNNFLLLLQSKFEIEKPSKKLQNWHELEFKDFLKELKKAKVHMSLSEEAEWMVYFNEQRQKAQELKTQIDQIDREIDQMVYELYGLTEEEIEIVENN